MIFDLTDQSNPILKALHQTKAQKKKTKKTNIYGYHYNVNQTQTHIYLSQNSYKTIL